MDKGLHAEGAAAWAWVASLISVLLRRRLPPGPTPLPIIGNVFDFPRKHLGREFAALSQRFGDVLYLNVLGQGIIMLGSLKAARDLLDKRSANYSDRPTSVMVQLAGLDWLSALINYGPRWRQHRRAIHPVMTPDAITLYEAVQLASARNFLRIILHSPQDLASHIRFTLTAMVMGVVYGIEIREPHDKYFQMVERMAEVAETILIPGNFPVEAFPALRYLPTWFPGGGFKKWAPASKRDILYTVDHLFDGANNVVATDASKRSVVNRILEGSAPKDGQTAEIEQICKEVAATLYVGGADTVCPTCRYFSPVRRSPRFSQSNAEMGAFFLAMALHPEVQKKAQAELDEVVGADRLPEFSDRASLPYVNAVVKEVLRWHPAGPINVPHRVVADDEYNGYFIPSGALVFVNTWSILRDPEVYARPDEFIPDRFLDSDGNLDLCGRDPADVVFGFGRRICPGRHFAESTMFILSASVLSAFEIGSPVGEDGVPVQFKREAADNNMIAHPKVHKYTMKPRSPHVKHLVEV
ncbi:hypothetical protein V8D89_004548 [Ganoderma adspersum]